MFITRHNLIQNPKTDGTRLYAIGDIHGRDDLLHQLLTKIETDLLSNKPEQKYKIIFLGDYVDRGFGSKEVIETLINLQHPASFLKGNHEDEALRFQFEESGLNWLNYGGLATMSSYGINAMDVDCPHMAWAESLLNEHRDFLENLEHSYSNEDYFFCHAGIDPSRALESQNARDLMWIREKFLNYKKPMEKVIVYGHTITPKPDFQPHRIGIDTGAYASGILTCLVLEGAEQRLLQTRAYDK